MLVLIAVCWQERILRFFTASDGSEESAVGSSWKSFINTCDSAAQAKVDGEQLIGAEDGSDTDLFYY